MAKTQRRESGPGRMTRLLQVRQAVHDAGGAIDLIALSAPVKRLLNFTGIDEVFPLYLRPLHRASRPSQAQAAVMTRSAWHRPLGSGGGGSQTRRTALGVQVLTPVGGANLTTSGGPRRSSAMVECRPVPGDGAGERGR